ncbi:hypothetical protein D9M68_360560 [compost metagenome]
MLPGQFGDAGQLGHFEHPRVADMARAEGDVVAQAAGQQRQVVGDVADLLAQVGDVELAQVEAVEQHLALVRLVEAHQQAAEGALAGAAAADDADLLARRHAQVEIAQRRRALLRIAELQLADFQRAVQPGALQRALAGLALLRQGHQRVGALHGQARLLVAGDQPGDLPERRQHAAAEHVAGDQRADAEVAVEDGVDPGDDHRHAGELLHEQGAVAGQRGEEARVVVQAGDGAVGGFPAVLQFAFSAAGLEGFQAAEGLDQQRLAFGAEGQALLHGVAQAHLDDEGEQHGQRKGQQRDRHQRAAEQADHGDHQQGEGQVDQAGQGQRGEEFAQALEVVDALGEAADRGRARLHGHAGDALEQRRREHHVGLLAGEVEQVRAQHAQQQFEQAAEQQAGGEHPEGRHGLVGHHAVVGLHDEQRHQQAEQVDHQAGDQRVGVQPARQLEGVAEPGLDPRQQRLARRLQFMPGAGEQRLAGVLLGQFVGFHPLLAALGLAGQDQRRAVLAPAAQHGAAAIAQEQQHWQVERGNALQLAAQHPPLQSGAGRRAGQQLGGEALFGQRQAAGEAGAAGVAAMQAAEDQQPVE